MQPFNHCMHHLLTKPVYQQFCQFDEYGRPHSVFEGDTDQTSPSSPFRWRFCSSRAYVLSQNSRLPSSQLSSSSSSVWLAAIPTDAGILYQRSIRNVRVAQTVTTPTPEKDPRQQLHLRKVCSGWFRSDVSFCALVLGSALCPARLVLTRGLLRSPSSRTTPR